MDFAPKLKQDKIKKKKKRKMKRLLTDYELLEDDSDKISIMIKDKNASDLTIY